MTLIRALAAAGAAVSLLGGAPRLAVGQEFKRGTYSASFNGMAVEAQFTDSGTVIFKANGEMMVTGTFTLKGDEIELRDRYGQLACPEDQVGRYKWKLSEKVLSLEVISDGCQGRQSVASQLWTWRDQPSW